MSQEKDKTAIFEFIKHMFEQINEKFLGKYKFAPVGDDNKTLTGSTRLCITNPKLISSCLCHYSRLDST
jgi:hypothetical protein